VVRRQRSPSQCRWRSLRQRRAQMAPAARVTTAVTTGVATASLVRHCLHRAKRALTAEGLQMTLATGTPECLHSTSAQCYPWNEAHPTRAAQRALPDG